MLKIVGLVVVTLIVLFVLVLLLARPRQQQGDPASFKDLPRYFAGLLGSDESGAFLIVTVPRTEEFIQFGVIDGGVEMDFPLITDQQKASERRIRDACTAQGLVARETEGSGGEQFLDFDLMGSADTISETVTKLVARIYEVPPDEPLSLVVSGWDAGAT